MKRKNIEKMFALRDIINNISQKQKERVCNFLFKKYIPL